MTPHLTVNYGLRYDTTFGLFHASGGPNWIIPALLTIRGSAVALLEHPGAPHDYRKAFAPRSGHCLLAGPDRNTVIRAGFGLLLQRPGAERLGDGVPGGE